MVPTRRFPRPASALMSSLDAYVQLGALSWMEKPAGTVDGTRAGRTRRVTGAPGHAPSWPLPPFPPPGPDPPVSTQLPRARVIRKPKAECAMETVCVPWPSTWALDHQRFFAKWAFRDLVDCHELISFSLARSSSCAVCADGGRVNLSSELGYKRAQLTDGPGSGAFVNEAAISRDLRGGCPDR